jgi:hypothetical protein
MRPVAPSHFDSSARLSLGADARTLSCGRCGTLDTAPQATPRTVVTGYPPSLRVGAVEAQDLDLRQTLLCLAVRPGTRCASRAHIAPPVAL